MAKQTHIIATKTYATEANAVKAVEKLFGKSDVLRYIVIPTPDQRFAPVFIGESAVAAGVHFHFNVIG